jgi:HAD superfamily hydrolase (TIGR01450 family)
VSGGDPRPRADRLLDLHDALLLDLDGVVYVGADPVPHAVESLLAAGHAGVTTAYVTNNASRPPGVVAEHLSSFGLPVQAHDVVTSAQAGAREVASRVPAGSRVLVVGGPGVAEAVLARGLVPVRSADDDPTAVLMGYGPDVAWTDLAEAAYAVGAGAVFVASNTDLSIPTARGIAPGNGTLVGAVVSATSRQPVVAGKPYAPLIDESVERIGARRPLIVGDRLDTDIEAGHRTGIPTLLVLTGVTDVDTLLAAPADQRPTYLAADLRGLGAAAADLAIADGGSTADDGLGAVRSECRRVWAATDAGERALERPGLRSELADDVRRALAR